MNDRALFLDAAGAVMSARVSHNEIGPIWRGVEIGDRAFMSMHDCDLIGTYDGIVWAGTTMFNEPKVRNNNINAQRWGIAVDGPDSLEFTDNTIRRHSAGWKGATNDWFGMKIANVADLKLSNNTVQPDESGGAFSGTMTAYSLTACSLALATDNFVGVGNDVGFLLDNCTGLIVDGTLSAQSNAGNVLFSLVNNTRLTTIAAYELVSTFAGTVLTKDASIIGTIQMLNKQFDLESTGNVNLDMTRVNAAADEKKWRTVVGSNSRNLQVLTDAGAGTNYELITRSGASVTQMEWRATLFKLTGFLSVGTLANLPNFTDDTAAAAGGVVVGQFYRTGSALKVRIV